MALAQISEIKKRKLSATSLRLGKLLIRELNKLQAPSGFDLQVRGIGLMVGFEILLANGRPATQESLSIVKRLLHRGFIILPEGEHANIIGFTPPLTISEAQLSRSVRALDRAIKEVCCL